MPNIDILAPSTIAALADDQLNVLLQLVALEDISPRTTYSSVFASAGNLAELAGLSYADATAAADLLWVAGYFQTFRLINADNADHTFVAYSLSTHVRDNREHLFRAVDHEAGKRGIGQ